MLRHALQPAFTTVLALTLIAVTSFEVPARPAAKTPAKKRYLANRGAKIFKIAPDSPATDAGLEVNDIIVSINGVMITSTSHLINTLKADTARMVVINNRDGQQVDVTAYPKLGKLGIDAAIVEMSDSTPYSAPATNVKRKKR